MKADLPGTTTRDVSRALVRLRSEAGALGLARVMTLIIITRSADVRGALDAATEASRTHPSRILTLVRGDRRRSDRMDAQVRIGGAAGVSEIVQLRLDGELAVHGESVVVPLLVPDSPIVAWWPVDAPDDVAASAIGRMADRRITDASLASNPRGELLRRRESYAEGDSDMAWSRTTRWRGLLATALDQPPYEQVTAVTVSGASDSASTDLLAGWLAVRLRCPVRRIRGRRGTGLTMVHMERASGPIELTRPDRRIATVTQPGQPPRSVDLSRPDTAASLAQELRSLDRDPTYRTALLTGLPLVEGVDAPTGTEAPR